MVRLLASNLTIYYRVVTHTQRRIELYSPWWQVNTQRNKSWRYQFPDQCPSLAKASVQTSGHRWNHKARAIMMTCCNQNLDGSMIKTKGRGSMKQTNYRQTDGRVWYRLTDGGVYDKKIGKSTDGCMSWLLLHCTNWGWRVCWYSLPKTDGNFVQSGNALTRGVKGWRKDSGTRYLSIHSTQFSCIHWLTYSFTTHSLTPTRTRSLTQAFAHSPTHSLTRTHRHAPHPTPPPPLPPHTHELTFSGSSGNLCQQILQTSKERSDSISRSTVCAAPLTTET